MSAHSVQCMDTAVQSPIAAPWRQPDSPCKRQVGGLRDTVQQFSPESDSGTGWTFEWADSGNFRNAMGNGMYTFREYRDTFRGIQRRGMSQDLTWDNAAKQYEEVLLAGKYQW